MSEISSDTQMRDVVNDMAVADQRRIAAMFVENVLSLSDDQRVRQAIEAAAKAANEERSTWIEKAAEARLKGGQ